MPINAQPIAVDEPAETDTTPATVTDAIAQAAIDGVASTSSDGQSVTRMSVRDQIAAAEFAAGQEAGRRRGLGIRRVKMLPPGNDC